jgi:site-specific recombinase XerD
MSKNRADTRSRIAFIEIRTSCQGDTPRTGGLLNGVRHSEMNLIPTTGINWEARQVRIIQGKTGNYKIIGPLGPTSMEILREFYDASRTELVFSRSGNVSPKFYRIRREACERAGVPYGRGTRDGLVLHDARHTATTHLLESNVSPKTVQEWMGWFDGAPNYGISSYFFEAS